ncbi:Cupredoxin [Setomelanomma holmii]|uniref:Cupredoxin n=1 Tax=Setomelanomma holmii TaxID=210430 RepID=A0A9P4HB91_9PLEO|nr:Cupredoxin [Setomelanomma holmii]
MLSLITHAAFALSLAGLVLGQAAKPTPNRFASEIPQSEAVALAGIVEDDPASAPAFPQGGSSSAAYTLYSAALPIPPLAQVKQMVINPVTNKEVWYYEMDIKPYTQQIYPGKSPARLVGYNGTSPGPTIVVPRGIKTVVLFVNHGDRESSIHLHGSPSRAPFDGWAEDLIMPGQYKDYYYPDSQSARFCGTMITPSTLQVMNVATTAENAYFGQAGAYLITDRAEDVLGLPSGYGQFDIPLVLSSKFYDADSTLKSSLGEEDSLWGDVVHVNGQPWPSMNVQPRKYRFRILNAAVSHSFDLYFVKYTATGTKLPFKVIASDAGLLQNAVQVQHVITAVAERWEIVFDFSAFAGQTILLRNTQDIGGLATDDEYTNTDKVMQFNVSATPVVDTSNVPQALRTVPFPPASSGIDHEFRFHRSNSQWMINDVVFADAANRVLMSVPRGKVEIWKLENKGDGWTHPIHVHLVDFRILQRNGRGVEACESAGLKDVVWLGKNEEVLVEAHYAPWYQYLGMAYIFHCHNLIHEDHDMMAAFNVTQLQELGYNEQTDFSNPEDARWSAKPFVQTEWSAKTGPFTQQAVNTKVRELALQQPYSEQAQVEAALSAAWADGSAQRRGVEKGLAVHNSGPISRVRRFVV